VEPVKTVKAQFFSLQHRHTDRICSHSVLLQVSFSELFIKGLPVACKPRALELTLGKFKPWSILSFFRSLHSLFCFYQVLTLLHNLSPLSCNEKQRAALSSAGNNRALGLHGLLIGSLLYIQTLDLHEHNTSQCHHHICLYTYKIVCNISIFINNKNKSVLQLLPSISPPSLFHTPCSYKHANDNVHFLCTQGLSFPTIPVC